MELEVETLLIEDDVDNGDDDNNDDDDDDDCSTGYWLKVWERQVSWNWRWRGR